MYQQSYHRYQQTLFSKLQMALGQENQIIQAATWIADTEARGRWIYSSGTGHSHMFAEENFYRAGGFARVIPILDPVWMLHESAGESTKAERREGYAA
jgi:uncharacterized phosphosugar-binding protein